MKINISVSAMSVADRMANSRLMEEEKLRRELQNPGTSPDRKKEIKALLLKHKQQKKPGGSKY